MISMVKMTFEQIIIDCNPGLKKKKNPQNEIEVASLTLFYIIIITCLSYFYRIQSQMSNCVDMYRRNLLEFLFVLSKKFDDMNE